MAPAGGAAWFSVAAASAVSVAAAGAITERALRAAGGVRSNFRGDRIVTAYGALIVIASAPALLTAALAMGAPAAADCAAAMALLAGFGALGLADDLLGDRRQTGLRGHVRALLRERRVTTGLVKAVGGLALGIGVAMALPAMQPARAVMAGGVIALCANALNLLDLRPGRMCAVFLAGGVAVGAAAAAAGARGVSAALAAVALPALAAYRRDARAEVMLGDTGSNALGALLGLAAVRVWPGAAAHAAMLLLLVALHAAAERWSLSAIIERSPVLRRLDALTGVRGPARRDP